MQPTSECCLLQANTQVIVSPKSRQVANGDASAGLLRSREEVKTEVSDESMVITDVTREAVGVRLDPSADDVKTTGLGRTVKWFQSLWHGAELPTNTDVLPATYQSEVWVGSPRPSGVCHCRVLPLEDFSFLPENDLAEQNSFCQSSDRTPNVNAAADWALLKQPLNVYIGLQTIVKGFSFYNHSDIPLTFLAVLRAVASPSDQQHAKRAERPAKSAEDGKEALDERGTISPRVVVRVVVLNLNAEVAAQPNLCLRQWLPIGHALLSPALRRQLSLPVKGQVALEPLSAAGDSKPSQLICYPLCQTVSIVATYSVLITPAEHMFCL
jgi:hypothetical protein